MLIIAAFGKNALSLFFLTKINHNIGMLKIINSEGGLNNPWVKAV
jgi:hypothetical protein